MTEEVTSLSPDRGTLTKSIAILKVAILDFLIALVKYSLNTQLLVTKGSANP